MTQEKENNPKVDYALADDIQQNELVAVGQEAKLREIRRDGKASHDEQTNEVILADMRRFRGHYILGDMYDYRNTPKGEENRECLFVVKEKNFDGWLGYAGEESSHDEAKVFNCPQKAIKEAMGYWSSVEEKHFEVMPVSKVINHYPGDINWPGNT